MKYKCAQCNEIFHSKVGERYDWRKTKLWFLPCPNCGAKLKINYESINAEDVTFFNPVSIIGIITFILFSGFLEVFESYNENKTVIKTVVAILISIYLVYIWYKGRGIVEPEKTIETTLLK